jgi:small GTP-binding protein
VAEEYDFLFKSIVVGDGGVGKTALTLRFSKGFFTEDYKMTIGVDFHVKTIDLDTEEGPIRCKLQLWDTGGQERFSSIRPMYYRGSLGAVLVFDLTNPASFEHLPQWIEEVRANIKAEIPLLLVGNKSDLIDQRSISIEEVNQFTNDFNLYYMETSAKTGDGVGDCFYILACLMIGQGVPEKLITNKTVYSPGNITLTVPLISSQPTTSFEPKLDYVAPPVPEPPTPEKDTPITPLNQEPRIEYEAPPVPEPKPSRFNERVGKVQEESEFEYEAPPVPEPLSKPHDQPVIRTPELTDIEFKTPDEILSEINGKDQIESEPSFFPSSADTSQSKTYKPKSIPFSPKKTPSPAPAPEGFQMPRESTQKQNVNAPFRVSKKEEPVVPRPASRGVQPTQEIPNKESSSQTLEDYLPKEEDSKKKKKLLIKQKKKQEKEQKLKIAREKQEQLIDAMKKSKKVKKEKKSKLKEEKPEDIDAPSLFQTLSQRVEDTSEDFSKDSFIPFMSTEEKSKEETSTLRIIPNVADIENEPSSFKAFNQPQTEIKQSESEKSKELLICKQCGATLSSDYAFCNKCGSKLS